MLFVDTADHDLIREAIKLPSVCGVTTNPTLIAKAAKAEHLSAFAYIEMAQKLCLLAKTHDIKELMIQGIQSPQHILDQAKLYQKEFQSKDTQMWIKLTPTAENLSLCAPLADMGCRTLVTAVFSASQAYMAMKAGADGIAVYLGRLMRLEEQWKEQVARIRHIVEEADKMLLMASFADLQTVEQALEYSTHLTVAPHILSEMLKSPHSDEAIKAFNEKISSPPKSAAA